MFRFIKFLPLFFEDFEAGTEYRTRARTVTETDVVSFAGLSGDFNSLHTDAEFMKESPTGERIAHGMLIVAIASGLSNQMGWFDGTTLALAEVASKFKAPVRFGDTIHAVFTLNEKKPSSKPDRGIVILNTSIRNQRDEPAIEGTWTLLMKRKVA